MIEDFSVITHEGLTTLAHSSRMGWTITSGTWNHLRETWGPTPETLSKIQLPSVRLLPVNIQERGMLVGITGSQDDTCVGLHG